MAKLPAKLPPPKLLPPELSWSTHEREQTWVLRYTENPKVGRDGKTRMVRMERGLWRYCFSRHKQRWLDTKRHKGPPTTYNGEGGIGWWFPTLWTKEFKGTIGDAAAARHPTSPIAETEWKLPFPGLKWFAALGLPEGTIIDAEHATVIYPNGAVEGWAAAERRLRGGGELPPASTEDEPPPPAYQ